MTCSFKMVLAGAIALTVPAQASAPSVLRDYDFSGSAAEQHSLPAALREVSGFTATPDGRIFAHGDESATIAELDASSGAIRKLFTLGNPAERGDFEGIAFADGRIFLLTSTGVLYAAREGQANTAVAFERYDTGAGQLCEMEGLAFDARAGRFLLPCKTPRRRELRGRVVVFSVPLKTLRIEQAPALSLPFSQLPAALRRSGVSLTSIEVVPGQDTWLLLSSQPAALIEVSSSGNLAGVEMLSPKRHPQAEALTFLRNRTILIADEGATGKATVTLYPLKKRAP